MTLIQSLGLIREAVKYIKQVQEQDHCEWQLKKKCIVKY